MQMSAYTPGALAELGYVCSACLKTPDVCACPYRERHGSIDEKPPLVHRDTLVAVGRGAGPPKEGNPDV